MDCVKKQSSKSSRNGKTTLKKGRENPYMGQGARNKKSISMEVNLVQSYAELSLSDLKADVENVSRSRRLIVLPKRKSGKGVGKKSKSGSTYQVRMIQPNRLTQPSHTIRQDAYIQIPLSVMSGNESTSNKNKFTFNEDESPSSPVKDQNVNYKLIEGFPSCADIRKRKSYVMSYNTETNNAEWVYEILNKSTLDKKCKENISFGKNELESKDYQQGHLAAAANHTWCQEAYHDTYLMSNMIPQLSDSNQEMWKTLENHCRKLAMTDCNVHVYTGPLYLKKKGKHDYDRVSKKSTNTKKVMPSHLFKVVIVEYNNGKVEEPECYVMPNEKSEYKDKIKEHTKLKEQAKLSNEELLNIFKESIEDTQAWSGLTFIKHKPQYKNKCTIPLKWMGEYENGESIEVTIKVEINTPPSSGMKLP